MTATYKTKVRVAQQCQQVVQLKQTYQVETMKLFHDCDVPERPPTRNTPSMSTDWNVLPFAYPENEQNQQKSKTINEILRFSLKQQKEDEITNNSGFVTVVVSRCLEAASMWNSVVCGIRHTHNSLQPHMWIDIDGYIIDNTYIKDFPAENLMFLCENTPKCYDRCDFSHLKAYEAIPKQQSAADTMKAAGIIPRKRIDFYDYKPDQALAIGLNREQSFNYYFAMIRYMYDKFGVSVAGIDPKIRSVCWWCGCYPRAGKPFLSDIQIPDEDVSNIPPNINVSFPRFKETDSPSKVTWKFPHCSRCTVAQYCSPECQKTDWLENHAINCFSRGSMYLPPFGDVPLTFDPMY
ncbi:unnamed protein product [Candidula unifasciata]|uniref:MYND-type domain-containing protein n=1 Tax=Candidula unifasciata TaxID=100452 RepID=A0A8S3YRP9_9EUPU|nr:unnamed protein product [Candidula unifasciata]